MKLMHINLVARDADRLAKFYETVFGCVKFREPRVLIGEKVSRGNGLADAEIYALWLRFPDCDTPFLEIHQHKVALDRSLPRVNEPGFGHLSFQVKDIEKVFADIIASGGAPQGEITDFGTPNAPVLIVYARDPEGNILELEQIASQGG